MVNSTRATLLTAALWLVVLFLALGLFSLTLFNNSHNEQMYVTAAYLLVRGEQLYTDFAFVQMPYAPQLYAFIYRLTGAGYYLFQAKIVNYLFLLLGALLLLWHVQRQTRDSRFTASLALLFFSNYYLFRTSIEASNYTIPIAFSLLAYVLFIRLVATPFEIRPSKTWLLGMAACGLFLALATGAKLYYATLFAPFGLAGLLYPAQFTWSQRLRFTLLPLASGTIAGLLPVLFVAWRNPENFYFNNLGYHMLNTAWRTQSGFGDMTLTFKLGVARDLLANPNFLVLVLWLALAALLTGQGIPKRRQPSAAKSTAVMLSGALSVVAILTSFTPSPLFPQYFAMPVPFLLAWIAALYATTRQEQPGDRDHDSIDIDRRQILRHFALACALVTTLVILPRHTSSLRRFAAGTELWAGVESVSVSQAIRAHLETNNATADLERPKIATLSPVYAVESELAIYPEFATGSFVYRIGDLLGEDDRQRYHAPSVSTVDELLDYEPPDAILITQEGDLEIPLEIYAQEHGYRAVELAFDDGRLYVR